MGALVLLVMGKFLTRSKVTIEVVILTLVTSFVSSAALGVIYEYVSLIMAIAGLVVEVARRGMVIYLHQREVRSIL